MRISYEYYTHVGDRKENEDVYGVCENRYQDNLAYLFAVADGAGSREGAQMAIDTLLHVFPQEDAGLKLLPGMFQLAQRMILRVEEARKLPPKSFRTTLAALQLDVTNQSFLFAHQGDTRVYAFRDGKFLTRTKDHSIAQKMVDQGRMPEMSLPSAPEKNQITRMLGVRLEKTVDTSDVYELRENMSFLVCSDGLWNYVTQLEMEETLQQSEFVGEWLAKLKKIALERGHGHKMDNQTAIAVFVRES